MAILPKTFVAKRSREENFGHRQHNVSRMRRSVKQGGTLRR
jgi:hypothetical protein